MSIFEVLLIAAAGFLAGGVNAVAGGGSLISFPALLATGLPALDANVTNTVAIWPGYVGSVVAYRVELRPQGARLLKLGMTAALGAVTGSVVLLVADESVFDAVVPALIMVSCLLLAAQPRIATAVAVRSAARGRDGVVPLHASTFVAGAYGAYFGGGLGVILLAVLGIFVADHLQHTNALKTAMSLLINTVALAIFVFAAPVDPASVAVIAPASLLGGFAGGNFARRLNPLALRATVIALGVVVAVVLTVN